MGRDGVGVCATSASVRHIAPAGSLLSATGRPHLRHLAAALAPPPSRGNHSNPSLGMSLRVVDRDVQR